MKGKKVIVIGKGVSANLALEAIRNKGMGIVHDVEVEKEVGLVALIDKEVSLHRFNGESCSLHITERYVSGNSYPSGRQKRVAKRKKERALK